MLLSLRSDPVVRGIFVNIVQDRSMHRSRLQDL